MKANDAFGEKRYQEAYDGWTLVLENGDSDPFVPSLLTAVSSLFVVSIIFLSFFFGAQSRAISNTS